MADWPAAPALAAAAAATAAAAAAVFLIASIRRAQAKRELERLIIAQALVGARRSIGLSPLRQPAASSPAAPPSGWQHRRRGTREPGGYATGRRWTNDEAWCARAAEGLVRPPRLVPGRDLLLATLVLCAPVLDFAPCPTPRLLLAQPNSQSQRLLFV